MDTAQNGAIEDYHKPVSKYAVQANVYLFVCVFSLNILSCALIQT